ncbi:hypothetical protein BJ138DRAFT_1109913 [Hygrophoropsis aurantiaca]|uniref:Uncharacterized protein n=1 Tax=Hygrophoropsis aurantiaca TaxID=72124 RepID=A0ACB8APH6_9AGAM|nr:hypothetical protein BJ138DRAFT_1109913 [Hygrophoropsis aurantiaca]
MVGPIRTSDTPAEDGVKPPRPPNAWILYRSDKLKSLPPTEHRRAQAEVSRLISNMWRSESDVVKLEYERRADARKAEHQRLYPNYRFQPVKREDKERAREEKKLAKERARAESKRGKARHSPYATPPVAGPSGSQHHLAAPQPQYMAMYNPEQRYGRDGPSPPLSAASSPNDTSSVSESHGQESLSLPQSAAASTNASPNPNFMALPQGNYAIHPRLMMPQGYTAQSQAPSPMPNSSATLPTPVEQTPVAGPSQWIPPQQQYAAQPLRLPAELATPDWSNPSDSQQTFDSQQPFDSQQTFDPSQGLDPQETLIPQINEFVNFDIPVLQNGDSYEQWQQSLETDPNMFSMESLMGMSSGVFSLTDMSPSDLLMNPSGELTVSLGQMMPPSSFNDEFFAGFDLNAAFAAEGSTSLSSNNGIGPTDPPPTAEDIAALISSGMSGPAYPMPVQQRQPSLFTQDVLSFLDIDGGEHANQQQNQHQTQEVAQQVRTHVPQQSHPMPILEQMSTNTQVPARGQYVPPTGAMYSSTRRVAASWKASFAMQDPPVEAESWN